LTARRKGQRPSPTKLGHTLPNQGGAWRSSLALVPGAFPMNPACSTVNWWANWRVYWLGHLPENDTK